MKGELATRGSQAGEMSSPVKAGEMNSQVKAGEMSSQVKAGEKKLPVMVVLEEVQPLDRQALVSFLFLFCATVLACVGHISTWLPSLLLLLVV